MRDARAVATSVIMRGIDGGPAIIEADRAEAKAEAWAAACEACKKAVDDCGGHGDVAPACCDRCAALWMKVKECLAAIDAIAAAGPKEETT